MRRPADTVLIASNIPAHQRNALDEAADAAGLTRSKMISVILACWYHTHVAAKARKENACSSL